VRKCHDGPKPVETAEGFLKLANSISGRKLLKIQNKNKSFCPHKGQKRGKEFLKKDSEKPWKLKEDLRGMSDKLSLFLARFLCVKEASEGW
jgi:hypothetical protein